MRCLTGTTVCKYARQGSGEVQIQTGFRLWNSVLSKPGWENLHAQSDKQFNKACSIIYSGSVLAILPPPYLNGGRGISAFGCPFSLSNYHQQLSPSFFFFLLTSQALRKKPDQARKMHPFYVPLAEIKVMNQSPSIIYTSLRFAFLTCSFQVV